MTVPTLIEIEKLGGVTLIEVERSQGPRGEAGASFVISALAALTSVAGDDVLPINDTSDAGATKKATVADLADAVAADSALTGAFVPGVKVVTSTLGDGPNVTIGHAQNVVAADISAATISGGGQANYGNVIGGDGSATVNTVTPNVVAVGTGASYSVITGGYDNVAGGLASFISGFHNYTAIGTNHGTIGGGSVQIISGGSYGTIAGGTANEVTAAQGTVSGGSSNEAGQQAVVSGGTTNTASGLVATIGGGQNHIASGVAATVVGGRENTASGASATAIGREALAYTEGQVAHASGKFAAKGDAQSSTLVMRRETTDATLSALGVNGSTSTIQLQQDCTVLSRISVVARDTSNGDSKAWTGNILATNDTAIAVTFIGGSTLTEVAADAGASAWTVALAGGADSFIVNVTGEAAKTIRWVMRLELLEVVG